jgi:hypothetical protein
MCSELVCSQELSCNRTVGADAQEIGVTPSGPDQRYDFFLSRRGSVAAVAREVADVLAEKGYKVLVQDYDIPLGASLSRRWTRR